MSKKNKKRSKLTDRIMEIIAMCIILDLAILFIHLLWPKDFMFTLIIIAIVDILIILFGDKVFNFLIEIITPF